MLWFALLYDRHILGTFLEIVCKWSICLASIFKVTPLFWTCFKHTWAMWLWLYILLCIHILTFLFLLWYFCFLIRSEILCFKAKSGCTTLSIYFKLVLHPLYLFTRTEWLIQGGIENRDGRPVPLSAMVRPLKNCSGEAFKRVEPSHSINSTESYTRKHKDNRKIKKDCVVSEPLIYMY